MSHFLQGSPASVIDSVRASALLDSMLESLQPLRRVLLLPPDFTRYHSGAGELTVLLYQKLQTLGATVEIMPALGTHVPMTASEIATMFPGISPEVFRVHDWRNGLAQIGIVPCDYVEQISEGRVAYPITCEVNRHLLDGQWDRIISIGQLVPHEVIGIANHNKNIFVGVGGGETIHKTHFLGAVYGMERTMGRAQSPVRDVFNYMQDHFLRDLPLTYLLNVRAKDENGNLVTRGLFAGEDYECFLRGAELCQQVNLDLLDQPLKKAVVYLDPTEFKSTWLGNKAIYRTRMAMADDGELIILAPGVAHCGEDREIDRLIRLYGYHGTQHTLHLVERNEDLRASLSAAAHLIHGSSEGRFRVTYCTNHLSRSEVEGIGYAYAPYENIAQKYNPMRLSDGFNEMPDGEHIFFVSNPALGLWGLKSQFSD